MPEFIRDVGIWKPIQKKFVKQAGAWVEIATSWIKDTGVWKQSFVNDQTVNIRFDVRGQKGQDFRDIPTNPIFGNASGDRRGSNGGFTRVDMIIPTAYTININDPTVRFPGGQATSPTWGPRRGGSSTGFSIDGEWMVIVGGGACPGAYYRFDSAFGYIGTTYFPAPGANGGVASPNGTGSPGGNGGYNRPFSGPTSFEDKCGGGGGGGAPGGPGGPTGDRGQPGTSGSSNIRIRRDQGINSGVLNINPEWSMSLVSSSNGSQTAGNVTITNKDTGGSQTFTSGSVPVADIANY